MVDMLAVYISFDCPCELGCLRVMFRVSPMTFDGSSWSDLAATTSASRTDVSRVWPLVTTSQELAVGVVGNWLRPLVSDEFS